MADSTPQAADTLAKRLASEGQVDRSSKTIAFASKQVEFVVLGSPEGSAEMTWQIDGLVNPTIIVPRGAAVRVHFYDADADNAHGWEVSDGEPPFSQMAMMDGSLAFQGAFGAPVSKATDTRWQGRLIHFTASQAGSYRYICPVPGHAAKGMYGTFLVKP